MPVDIPAIRTASSPTAQDILNRIKLRAMISKGIPVPEPTVAVGQIALLLDAEGLEDNFIWVLARVTDVGVDDFGYDVYSISHLEQWIRAVPDARRPFTAVVAAYGPNEAVEIENKLRRFDTSQQRVLTVYHNARRAFTHAVREQDQTAMANLLQDSEKLENEISDLVSKFGVNVALFTES